MLEIGRLLTDLGISARRDRDSWVSECPNPEHRDRTPSWSIVDRPGDRRHGSHKCFGCGLRGGPWELAAAVWNCTVTEAGRRLSDMDFVADPAVSRSSSGARITRSRFRWPATVIIPRSQRAWDQRALEYLHGRGLTNEQVRRWGAGYQLAVRRDHADRVVVPVYTAGRLVNFTARAYAQYPCRCRKRCRPTQKYMTGRRVDGAEKRNALLGDQFLDESRRVVSVTEGFFKICSLERANWPNPCALLGSNLGPIVALRLSRFPVVLAVTDPDQAGDKAASALSLLSRRGCRVVRVRLPRDPDEMSDEELQEARADVFSRENLLFLC